MFLVILTLGVLGGTTNLDLLIGLQREGMLQPLAASALAMAALVVVALGDTDRPDAAAEFSATDLAMTAFAEALRLLVWFDLIGAVFLPVGMAAADAGPIGWVVGVLAWAGKLAALTAGLAVVRHATGRLRVRRVPVLLGVASVLGLLDEMTRKFSSKLSGTSVFIPAVIMVLAFVPGVSWPQEFAADAVPMKLVEKHLDLLSSGRLFASDQIADYLVFLNPRQKVFIDSRHNYYGDKIGNDYIAIAGGSSKWRSLLDQYGIDVVLAETNAPITSLVKTTADFVLVDSDKQYALFARRRQ